MNQFFYDYYFTNDLVIMGWREYSTTNLISYLLKLTKKSF